MEAPAPCLPRTSLRSDLERLGIGPGDDVMVHAAMSRVGPLLMPAEEAAHRVVDAAAITAFAVSWLERRRAPEGRQA
jgi:aminoglycoside N3'-acetyltransferase